MPLQRHITVEEDITLSVSTTVAGLVAKYNINGTVDAKVLLASIAANLMIVVNDSIEGSNLSLVEKATLRGDIKTLASRIMRAKLGMAEPAEEKQGLRLVVPDHD